MQMFESISNNKLKKIVHGVKKKDTITFILFYVLGGNEQDC